MAKIILQKELEYFEKNKSKYLETYKNTFVLIKSDKLLGNFTTQQEAYQAGIKEYGNKPFLIKYVTDNEYVPIHAQAVTITK